MRLSNRIFVALAVLAGTLFAFSPDVSAHKNTGSEATVTGTVTWPAGAKTAFDLKNRTANFGGTNLSLDSRAASNTRLNGCRRAGGNPAPGGLPVGDPTTATTYTSSDLCFLFTGLAITTVGLWDGLNHKTNFACDASGTTGASGNDKPTPTPADLGPPPNLQAVALGATIGASYGEFTCNGSPIDPAFLHVPSADGHFHLLSPAATVVGFLGEIHCTVAIGGVPCPKNHPGNQTRKGANGGHTTPVSDADHNNSRIKHTVACKGDVTPTEFGSKFVVPPLIDTVTQAAVTLVCSIA